MAKNPLNIKIYDPFLRPIERPNVDPDAEPTVCVRINEAWIPALMGALWPLRYTDKWKGTATEKNLETQRTDELIYLLSVATTCEGNEMPLRQKPGTPCILQQSLDGGISWVDVFDFSLCEQPVTVEKTESITNIWNDAQNYYTEINNTYNGDPANLDPRLVYGDANDSLRDAALCLALQSFVETASKTSAKAAKDTEADAVLALDLVASSFGTSAGVLGAAAAAGIVTGILASPALLLGLGLAAGAASIGAIIVDANDDAVEPGVDLLTESERREVWCCMYEALAGATLTESAFQSSLDNCNALTLQASVFMTIIQPVLSERQTYLALLTMTQQLLDAAFAGDLPNDCGNCNNVWAYEWDFTQASGGWAADFPTRENVGVYESGNGWRGTAASAQSDGNRGAYLAKDIPVTDIVSAKISWQHSMDRGGAFQNTNGGNQTISFGGAAGVNVNSVELNYEGCSRLLMHVTTGDEYGDLLITRIEISGTGSQPATLTGGQFI